jgi:hypothetical protein
VARFDPTGTYLAVGFDDGTVEVLHPNPRIIKLKQAQVASCTLAS